MDLPAEIHRRSSDGSTQEVVIAKGPLVIMAHGILALNPAVRDAYCITTHNGVFSAAQADEALRRWNQPVSRL